MIYNDEDITCYARMHGKTYVVGHPEVVAEIMHMDGTFDFRILLTPENIERLLAGAKEAGLV